MNLFKRVLLSRDPVNALTPGHSRALQVASGLLVLISVALVIASRTQRSLVVNLLYVAGAVLIPFAYIHIRRVQESIRQQETETAIIRMTRVFLSMQSQAIWETPAPEVTVETPVVEANAVVLAKSVPDAPDPAAGIMQVC
ncbi:MAG: hypothetical protein U0Q18_15890 [Bryobacteraceae bacterium]